MLKIGLTGGIGSGKSTVALIFQVLGIPVFDADKEAKFLMENDESLIQSIKGILGNESYNGKSLNRTYIANIVFNDPYKLSLLNAVVHPATIHSAKEWMKAQNTPYVVKEAALMFEAGSADNLDYVIGVTAPQHLRIQRVIERDKVTREQVLSRMDRQLDDSIKMKLCDFVLINDEQQLLIPQVVKVHKQLEKLICP